MSSEHTATVASIQEKLAKTQSERERERERERRREGEGLTAGGLARL